MLPDARSVRERLNDILDCSARIRAACAGAGVERFRADPLLPRAVLYDMLCIGEAAARIPDEVLAAADDVPWDALIGLRNRLAHGYFAIDLDLVWTMVQTDLPVLEKAVNQLLDAR